MSKFSKTTALTMMAALALACVTCSAAGWQEVEEVQRLQAQKKTLQQQGGRAEEIRQLNLRLIEVCSKLIRNQGLGYGFRNPDYASTLVTQADAYLETGDLASARKAAMAALPVVDKSASLYRSGALGFRGLTAEQSLERMVTKRKDQMLPGLVEVFKKLLAKAPGDVALAKNLKAAEEMMPK